MARPRLRLLAAASAALLLFACSGDDGDKDQSASQADGSSSTVERLTDKPCEVLDIRDISQVTGLEFDRSVPGSNVCVYTSSASRAVVTIVFRAVGGSPEERLAADRATCDEGTVTDPDLPNSDGSLSCLTHGIPTVVAVGGDGIEVVLNSGTLNEGANPDLVVEQLETILRHALQASDSSG